MSAAAPHAALAEILRCGAAIMVGERLVGGPRAVDLASVAARALDVELRAADAVQTTWEPEPEQQAPKLRRPAR
jgi:hypothetical protein